MERLGPMRTNAKQIYITGVRSKVFLLTYGNVCRKNKAKVNAIKLALVHEPFIEVLVQPIKRLPFLFQVLCNLWIRRCCFLSTNQFYIVGLLVTRIPPNPEDWDVMFLWTLFRKPYPT